MDETASMTSLMEAAYGASPTPSSVYTVSDREPSSDLVCLTPVEVRSTPGPSQPRPRKATTPAT
ncbi:hypothetical protein BC941DRAFT_513979, partial [Chlamydoabsidia padenii]